MIFKPSLDNCKSYIDCQLKRLESPAGQKAKLSRAPVVTISRLAGAGGVTVGEKLAAYLQRHDPRKACPWTVFDKNLVSTVLEDHHFSQRLAEFMPEDKLSAIRDAIEEILGLHPPSWTLVEKMAQTILHLAEMGNAIIIGRGANIVIGPVPNAFHVRLVGSFEKRQKHIQEHYHFSPAEACAYIKQTDRGRRRYVRRCFDKDIEDPMLNHMVLNTDWLTLEQAAAIIGDAVLKCREVECV
jgi:hypothetical protein